MTEGRKWPQAVWIVRHGESRGNQARQKAELEGLPDIGIQTRDVDVELSDLGRRQASALGRWFGSMPQDGQPTVVLTSPYRRTRMTAEGILGGAGIDQDDITYVLDERLREREFGILEGLTKKGVRELYEHQAHFRDLLGKFYHRPPGGESWCDVILRLRSVTGTLSREYRGERVLIVCHAVVVYCLRYLLEGMTEEDILEIDRRNEVANCSVTSYVFDPSAGKGGKLVLVQYNDVSPLKAADTEITNEPAKTSAFRPPVQGPAPLRSFLHGRVTVTVGDIADQHVGAVVNSANSMLRDGSGVTGAIFAAAGEGLREECERLRRTSYPQGLPAGEAVIMGGGNLPAPHVIHTVGPIKGENGERDDELLAACYRNSLALAVERGVDTVAIPAISTGIYGYPPAEAAGVSSAAIEEFLAKDRFLREVRLVFYSPRDAEVFLSHQKFQY